MMTFQQLERYCEILQQTEKYRQFLLRYDNYLKSVKIDGMPHTTDYRPDSIGELVVKAEEVREKLTMLTVLAESMRPEVEQTITAACRSGKSRIKAELIFRARYIHGKDWVEISEQIHEPDIKLLKKTVTQRLKKMEGK